MFDISFSELTICFVVALVVLGPERLPKVARTIGQWAGRARGYMRNLSSELERETEYMEIKRQLLDAKSAMKEAEKDFQRETESVARDIERDLNQKP